MIETRFPISNTTPDWVRHCFDSPADGVQLFLQELCAISGAEYAHIRVRSRFGRFYTMVESIGPYKLIGWHRRFNLLDHKEQQNLAYEYVDYGYYEVMIIFSSSTRFSYPNWQITWNRDPRSG
jgi:hypothetical protein